MRMGGLVLRLLILYLKGQRIRPSFQFNVSPAAHHRCHRLPLWSYFKLAVNCWLVLPYFSGAAYIYQHYVRPLFANRAMKFWSGPRKKDSFNRADNVLLAAERFVEEYGPEALERLISKVGYKYFF